MPSQKQEFSYPGKTTEQLLQAAYGTFILLGWTPKYAGPDAIIGYTPRSWNKYDDEVLIEAKDGSIVVTSSLVHNESFDMMGKNKKHIKDFITAFDKINSSAPKAEWADEIEKLRQQTAETVTKEVKETEEINKVMNLSGANLYITYGIITINVIVFILMAIDGAGIFDANGLVHVKWGSNFSPLTLSGDWWRLITSTFIHFGIIHLAMNMYALYSAGIYLEPMLGKIKYITAYLCTGVIAGIVSLWWHKDGVNSAGASGAIFGMYGVFLALLFTNLIPKQVRTSLLQSIGIFVVFNIVYGMRSGIDNAAHIGGLLSGIVIGFIFYPLLKKDDKSKDNLVLLGITAATILSAWIYLKSPGNIVSQQQRRAELNYLREAKFPDGEKLFTKIREFAASDEKIETMINDNISTYKDWLTIHEENIKNELDRAGLAIVALKQYDVSEAAKQKIRVLEKLWITRKEEFMIIKQLAEDDNPANQLKMAEIRQRQQELLMELNKND